jgi:hypothetical protein
MDADQDLAAAIDAEVDAVARRLVDSLLAAAPEALAERRDYALGFEERLRDRWGAALDLYELTFCCSQEWGSEFHDRHRRDSPDEADYVFEALTQLHSRACVVASEILALLESGHASGAEARWRTLHEVSVVAQIIAQRDEGIALRYLHHRIIEAAEDAEELERHRKRLKGETLGAGDLEALRASRRKMLALYGRKQFQHRNGWAAPLFGGKPPEFGALERMAGLDHLAPYRTRGIRHTHPGSFATGFGVVRRGPNTILQTGPTNRGLADAGHGSLISLTQVTTALFISGRPEPDPDWLARAQAMLDLTEKAGDAFLAAHRQLEADEKSLWAGNNDDVSP